jgi:hypothetical protein
MPVLLGLASHIRLWETPYGPSRQTLNQRAVGSSPTAPTNPISGRPFHRAAENVFIKSNASMHAARRGHRQATHVRQRHDDLPKERSSRRLDRSSTGLPAELFPMVYRSSEISSRSAARLFLVMIVLCSMTRHRPAGFRLIRRATIIGIRRGHRWSSLWHGTGRSGRLALRKGKRNRHQSREGSYQYKPSHCLPPLPKTKPQRYSAFIVPRARRCQHSFTRRSSIILQRTMTRTSR